MVPRCVAAGLLTACGGESGGGGGTPSSEPAKVLKLAFVTNNTSEFWKIAANGVQQVRGARARSRSTSRCRRTARPRSRTRSSRTWSSQGYDAIAVSVIAPKDQVPVLNRVAGEDEAHHVRLGRAGLEAPALHRHQQLRGGQGARRARSCKLLPKGGQDGGVRRHASPPTTPRQRLKGIEDAIKRPRASRSSTSARTTPTAPRRARTSRTSSTRTAT